MKQTFVRLKKENFIVSLDNCTFYKCGTIALFCDEDSENECAIYTQDEWEYITKDIAVQPVTYAEALAAKELEYLYRQRMNDIKYVDNYPRYSSDQLDEIKDVMNTHFNPNWKDEDGNYGFDSKGWETFCTIREKYREQCLSGNCVNEFELEPFGFKTEDLINSCMCEIDLRKQYKNYSEAVRKELGLDS